MRANCINTLLAEITYQSEVVAAATAAVVTIPAEVDQCHILTRVDWSYSAAPTGGRLTVVCGSTTILDLDIIAGGPGSISFYTDCSNPGLHNNGTANEAMVITLASGAGAVVGKLNVGTV